MRNIPLDCFRGIFALIVALGHFYAWSGFGENFPSSFVYAVDFFFVLSGFVLTNSIMNSDKNNDDGYVNFFIKRIFRIFPLYYFTTLVGMVCSVFLYNLDLELNYMRIFQILFLGQMTGFSDGGDFLHNSPVGIAWSISAEIWVGFIYFTIVFLLKCKQHILFTVSLVISWICFVIMNRYSPNGMEETYRQLTPFITFGSIRCLLGFSMGFIIWFLSRKIFFLKENTFINLSQVLIVILIFYLYTNDSHNRQLGILSPIFSSILIFLFTINTKVFRLLNNKVGKFLGEISYSLYLTHPVVIAVFIKLNLAPSFLYVCISLFLLYISYFYVENKFIKKVKYVYNSNGRS